MLADSGRIIEGYGAGTLPKANDPFMVGCSERGEVDLPSMRLLEGLSPTRIVDRAGLSQQLDADRRRLETRAGDRSGLPATGPETLTGRACPRPVPETLTSGTVRTNRPLAS